MSGQRDGLPGEAGEQGWESISRLWHQQPAVRPVPAAVISRVRRQEGWLQAGMVCEWLVAAALCGLVLAGLIRTPDSTSALIAVMVFALVLWALVFSVRNRRGLWQPLEETTRGYLALVALRIQRRRRAIRFAWLLFTVELLLFIIWELLVYWGLLDGGLDLFSVRAAVTIALMTTALILWSVVAWWHCHKEMRSLSRLQQQDAE